LRLRHDIRLIPPSYVKPFVKRQKNDAAEAICEASQRRTMRFVQVKSEASQAAAIVFRARDLLVRQRTQVINALRGHLAEFGFVVAKGPTHVERLIAQARDQVQSLPEAARPVIAVETLNSLDDKIAVLLPITVIVFTDGKAVAQTKTNGPRADLSDSLKLADSAALNFAFEGILSCRPGRPLFVVSVIGNSYTRLTNQNALLCPP
jgi:transposase